MIDLSSLEAWFVTGSQHLYGSETLKAVEQHSTTIARALSESSLIPVKIIAKPVMTSSESIQQLCLYAYSSKNCIGLINCMHTFYHTHILIGALRIMLNP